MLSLPRGKPPESPSHGGGHINENAFSMDLFVKLVEIWVVCVRFSYHISLLSSSHGLSALDVEHIAPDLPCCRNASFALSPL